jgi:iron complex outermembrane recepter protein
LIFTPLNARGLGRSKQAGEARNRGRDTPVTRIQLRKRALLMTVSLIHMGLAGQAFAQAGAPAEVEAIVVTGTAIRGVAPVGSATVNLNRETLVEGGVRDASTLISQLPQGSGLGNTLQTSGGRSAGVNLRGLGNNATLLLFDGHRTVSQGVTSQISDPNTIPFAAIDRVEVVTDGASAIYGSDAVAGVVNYILRKPFDGAEITARYTNSLYEQYSVEGVISRRWEGGGILGGLSYESNDLVLRNEVPRLAADQRPYGGNDSRFNGTAVTPGAAGALIIGTTVYGIPSGLNGRVPTAAEINALRGNPTVLDIGKYQAYYTKRERISGIIRANQDFGRYGELTGTLLFNKRSNSLPGTGDGAFTNVSVTVRPTSPFYIAGLGTGNQTVVYNFRENNPGRIEDRKEDDDTINLLADYKVDLFGDFAFTASGGYGVFYGCATCQPQGNTVLTAVIADASFNRAFNPYQQGPQAGAEGVFGIFVQKARNQLIDFVTKVDGSLFELPAGNVRIAAGYEYQKLDFGFRALNSLNLTTSPQTSRYAKRHRIINSVFAEAFVPLFGADNAIPGFQRLDLSAAVRYDDYSDVGSTTNPKVGVSWRPVDDLLIRGSWGTSFRAPTLGESDPRTVGQTNRVFVSNGLNNPAIPVTNTATGQSLVLQRGGNSGGLGPESAEIYSVGADYNPSFIEGLRLGLTYYNVDYKDRIENLPNANLILSSQSTFAQYRDFFIAAPQPSTCVNGGQPGIPGTPQYSTYNPAYLPWLSDPNAVYSPSSNNDCQLVGIITGGLRNLGRVKQSGIDLTANYATDLEIGRLSFGGSFSKVLDLKRSLLPNSPLFKALDTIGNQVSERGRFNVGLSRGAFSGNLSANYVGSYLNNATITVAGVKYPDTKIPSWTTFDARVAYTAPAETGVLAGVSMSVNVTNLTDKDPPIVLSGNSSVDLANHSLWGRVWQFEITKKF